MCVCVYTERQKDKERESNINKKKMKKIAKNEKELETLKHTVGIYNDSMTT